jgi:hypothetical protein
VGIDPISLNTAGGLQTTLLRPVRWTGGDNVPVYRKHFGEPIPDVANIRNNPLMLDLFSRLGMLARLQSKLNTLSRKKGRIIPAKKTIACALRACEETDNQDIVFAGVEFLGHYHTEEETIAGVLAHEWGHLLSDWTEGLDPDRMSWEQIHELRKEEEAAADGFAGKMLYQMGYSPNGMVKFLSKIQKKECAKYHSTATREAIIRTAFTKAQRIQHQAQAISAAIRPVFSNPFTQKLIAVA